MTAVSEPALQSPSKKHLRPFDVRRDLQAVADLVELCFADTLDADGRRYLQHMRSTANNASLLRWTALTSEWTSAPLTGCVWEQDGRIVGNASLIPYYLGGKRYYLIANVAVHPDYRRQGIARQLTEHILQHARARNVPEIWLHVRDDNQGAVDLYTSLGFSERTRRTTWGYHAQVMQAEPQTGVHFVTPRLRHWKLQRDWLRVAYPPQFAWHLAIDFNLLRPGLLGILWGLINHAHIVQWSMLRDKHLLGVVTWKASAGASDQLFLAAPLESDEDMIYALLVHALQRIPSTRPVSLDYPAGQFSGAIQAAGFIARQTLIWMQSSLE